MLHAVPCNHGSLNLTPTDPPAVAGNRIGSAGVVALADALYDIGVGLPLERLWLHENRMGDEGIAALARAFAVGAVSGLRVRVQLLSDAFISSHQLSSALISS